ncbi:MAG TPA: OadG family transporter subunit, partial [Candidatus Kapabacteria bacterium]|nr:OadG family transporter subunit [Candidatus Kapabacteria bacterium]
MFWDNILEGFLVLIVGLTGVLTVLFLFYLIIEGVNKLEYLLVENQKKKAERAKAANSIVSSENEEDLIAILTAAASVTLSGKIK